MLTRLNLIQPKVLGGGMATANQETKTASIADDSGVAPMLIDLGRKNAKDVRRLRKGKGKLVEEIHGTIAELKSAGTISMTAQPVIVVVREKRLDKGLLSMLKV
jgi:hypothetical protein